MAMTIEQIRVLLGSDEPNYALIGRLLQRDDVPSLETLAQSADEMMASKATYAISLVPSREARAAMQRLATSPSVEVRIAVAGGLPRLAAQDAGPIAERLLGDSDVSVRKNAVKASRDMQLSSVKGRLRQISSGDAVPGLRALAKSAVDGMPDSKP